MSRKTQTLELEVLLLVECVYRVSKILSPWGRDLYPRLGEILSRWPTPLVRQMRLNEKLELHTSYVHKPQR